MPNKRVNEVYRYVVTFEWNWALLKWDKDKDKDRRSIVLTSQLFQELKKRCNHKYKSSKAKKLYNNRVFLEDPLRKSQPKPKQARVVTLRETKGAAFGIFVPLTDSVGACLIHFASLTSVGWPCFLASYISW